MSVRALTASQVKTSEDFAAKETKEEQAVSPIIDGVHSENVKPVENHLLRNVRSLQHRVNNWSIERKKKSFQISVTRYR